MRANIFSKHLYNLSTYADFLTDQTFKCDIRLFHYPKVHCNELNLTIYAIYSINFKVQGVLEYYNKLHYIIACSLFSCNNSLDQRTLRSAYVVQNNLRSFLRREKR